MERAGFTSQYSAALEQKQIRVPLDIVISWQFTTPSMAQSQVPLCIIVPFAGKPHGMEGTALGPLIRQAYRGLVW
jgi:hypothetical protein